MSLPHAPVGHLVSALASANQSVREDAARELHRRGSAQAETAISSWRQIPELAALLSGHCTVGIAVTPEHFAKIHAALGNPTLADVPPDQDAQEFEWHLDSGVHLDILTTRLPGGSGAIARYLVKFGEGIQQVELLAKDVDRATELIRSRLGLQPVYPQTRLGAGGTRVNFFLVASPSGRKVLIELVENPNQP
ncbi:MAG TPA: hypothetical protein VGS15_03670 [Candidatus Acidoferrales bacterium]|nr:hypothetical protein [Candidatus Acidoferrales bacterium]